LEAALNTHFADLDFALGRLTLISRHDALLILRISLGTPRMLHTIRSAPCVGHHGLIRYDNRLRVGLEQILNITLSENLWSQATLPIKYGGLGIRRVPQLALPAFLASAAGTLSLQNAILGSENSPPYGPMEAMMAQWQTTTDLALPEPQQWAKQNIWDKPLLDRVVDELSNSLPSERDQARLKAVAAPHAGDWLLAMPIT